MLNLSHALSLTELKVYSLVNYVIVWYFIYNALKLVQQDGVLRLKITTVLFYATVPTSLATYLLVEAFQGLNGLLNSVHIHFLLVVVAFYVFSTIEEIRIKDKRNWLIILHHIVFGSVILFFAIVADIPSYWLWLPAVQFSGIFPTSRNVLKSNPSLYKRFNSILEEADFWCFLVSRIGLQTLAMGVVVLEVYTMSSTCYLCILAPASLLSTAMNIKWFSQILAKRSRAVAKSA